jgi:carboxymethylenebutenolidase
MDERLSGGRSELRDHGNARATPAVAPRATDHMPPARATAPIVTPADGLVAGSVEVPVKGGTLPAYRAMPATGTAFPVILVVQEIFGVNEHVQDICRRFAQLGYFAIAAELYARQGDPRKVTDIPQLIESIVKKVPDAQVMSDLDATVAYAKSSGRADVARLGITGFCWGGRIVLMYAAHNPHLKAAVAWYGPTARPYHPTDKTAIEVAGHVKAATLGLYGGADHGIPVDTVETAFAAIRAGGNRHAEYHVYPDTPHAFFADYRPGYTKAAAEDGWQRAVTWFGRYL